MLCILSFIYNIYTYTTINTNNKILLPPNFLHDIITIYNKQYIKEKQTLLNHNKEHKKNVSIIIKRDKISYKITSNSITCSSYSIKKHLRPSEITHKKVTIINRCQPLRIHYQVQVTLTTCKIFMLYFI